MTENKTIIKVFCEIENDVKLFKWKVREGFQVNNGQVILLYQFIEGDDKEVKRFKSSNCGVIKKRFFKDGEILKKGDVILELAECIHTTVIKDMCADCGADLRQNENGNVSEASVPMIHSVPELKVTQERALELGQADTDRLLEDRKLVLLVDLDQTLIHTTNDNVPNNLKDIYHFQLYGPNSPWYHTKLRPGTLEFLEKIAPFFELHICTFGARDYAHTIATFLDKEGKYFSYRILSRDECFNATSKTDNLKALFPCGESMVCIIDDREDVWNMATNLIQVKPYHFFQHTGDINAPPGMSKHELDGKGVDFNELTEKIKHDKIEIEIKKKLEDVSKTEPDGDNDKIKSEDTNKDSENKDKDSESKDKVIENKEEETIKKVDEIIEKTDSSNITADENLDKEKTSQNHDEDDDEIDVETNNDLNDETKEPSIPGTPTLQRIEDDLIEIDDPDDYLLYLEEILKLIHKRFYSIYDDTQEIQELKTLIPQIRSEVLNGKNLVFSGLIPNHLKLNQSKPYKIAKSLGAKVTQQLNDSTTHLVALTAGTFKVNAARKKSKIKIVTPDWLWSCAERWEHVDERLFPLDPNKPSKMRQPPAHCHSPEHSTNYQDEPTTSSTNGGTSRIAKPEPKFMDTINPLLKFTNDDLAKMNEEFDEFFESSSSSDNDEPVDIESPPIKKTLKRKRKQDEKEEETNVNYKFFAKQPEQVSTFQFDANSQSQTNKNDGYSSSSSDEDGLRSISERFRQGGDLPSDLDMGSDNASEGSEPPLDDDDDGDWNMMGAALEREFLGLDP